MADETVLGIKVVGLGELNKLKNLLQLNQEQLAQLGLSTKQISGIQRAQQTLGKFAAQIGGMGRAQKIFNDQLKGVYPKFIGDTKKAAAAIESLRKNFQVSATQRETSIKRIAAISEKAAAQEKRTNDQRAKQVQALSQQRVKDVRANRAELQTRGKLESKASDDDARIARTRQEAFGQREASIRKVERTRSAAHTQALKDDAARTASIKRMSAATSSSNIKTQELLLSWRSLTRIFGIQLAHRALSAFTSAIKEGIANVIELEKRVSELQTISQEMPLTLNEWSAGSRALSDAFGLPVLDQVEAAYQVLSNQVAEGAQVFNIMRQANKLAIAAVTDTSVAVNALTAVLNSFRLNSSDTQSVAAKLFKTVELGRLRLEDLARTLGRVTVPGEALGFTLEEVLGPIQTITIAGVPFRQSMTQLLGIFNKFVKPTKAMTALLADLGFENIETAARVLGLTGIIQKLIDVTGGVSTEIVKYINRQRGARGAVLLLNSGFKVLTANISATSDAMASFEKAIDAVLASSGKKLEIELNKIKNFFQFDFAQPALQKLDQLTNGFVGLTEAVEALSIMFAVALPAGIAAAGITLAGFLSGPAAGVLAIGTSLGAGAAAAHFLSPDRLAKKSVASFVAGLDEIQDAQDKHLSDIFSAIRNHNIDVERASEQVIAAQISALARLTNESSDAYTTIADDAKTSMARVEDIITTRVGNAENAFQKFKDTARDAFNEIDRIQRSGQTKLFDIAIEGASPSGKVQRTSERLAFLRRQAGQEAGRGDFAAFRTTSAEVDRLIDQQFQQKLEITNRNVSALQIQTEKERVINELIAERLRNIQTIIRVNEDAARKAEIRAAAEKFRQLQISDVAGKVFGFKPKTASVEETREQIANISELVNLIGTAGLINEKEVLASARFLTDQKLNLEQGLQIQIQKEQAVTARKARILEQETQEEKFKLAQRFIQKGGQAETDLQKILKQFIEQTNVRPSLRALIPFLPSTGRGKGESIFEKRTDFGATAAFDISTKNLAAGRNAAKEILEAGADIDPERLQVLIDIVVDIIDRLGSKGVSSNIATLVKNFQDLGDILGKEGSAKAITDTRQTLQVALGLMEDAAALELKAAQVETAKFVLEIERNRIQLDQVRQTLATQKQINATSRDTVTQVASLFRFATLGFADGGPVFQSHGTDTVPAMLTPGEFVTSRGNVNGNITTLTKIAGGAKFDGTLNLAEGGQVSMENTFNVSSTGNAAFDARSVAAHLRTAESRGTTRLVNKPTRRIFL